jgi:hypothetical protein
VVINNSNNYEKIIDDVSFSDESMFEFTQMGVSLTIENTFNVIILYNIISRKNRCSISRLFNIIRLIFSFFFL